MALNYSPFDITSGGFSALASHLTTAGRTAFSIKRDTPTTNNIVDEIVVVSVVTPSGWTPSANTFVAVFAIGSNDGTVWPDAMTPNVSSAAITLSVNGNNMRFLGPIPCTAASGTFVSAPMSVAAAFGGVMPKHYAIAIQNYLPATFSITSGLVNGQSVYYN